MFKKNKRAEVTTQIFFYVMVVVVMGLALLLGYRFISKLSNQSSKISLDEFKSDLTDSINSVSTNFGEVQIIELKLPTQYSQICFINKSLSEESNLDRYTVFENYTLIKSSVEAGVKDNTFIMSKKIESSFRTENVVLENNAGLLCIQNNAGFVKLRLESLGNAVRISQTK
jgi:hypothetical protein